MPVGWVLG